MVGKRDCWGLGSSLLNGDVPPTWLSPQLIPSGVWSEERALLPVCCVSERPSSSTALRPAERAEAGAAAGALPRASPYQALKSVCSQKGVPCSPGATCFLPAVFRALPDLQFRLALPSVLLGLFIARGDEGETRTYAPGSAEATVGTGRGRAFSHVRVPPLLFFLSFSYLGADPQLDPEYRSLSLEGN